jgi:ribosomal protein S1
MLCCVLQAGAETSSDRKVAQQLAVQQLLSEKEIAAGDLLDGVVTSLQAYGAFVTLNNGVQGLLHISQISHERLMSARGTLVTKDTGTTAPVLQCYL